MITSRRGFVGGVSAAALLAASRSAVAQKKYDDGATDFYPVQAVQLSRFKGETWELFGDVMHNESA